VSASTISPLAASARTMPPDAGGGQVVHGTGQRPGHPHHLTVRARDRLQVHPVPVMLTGGERPVGSHRAEGD
jgi:hypothetical protein